MSTITQIYDKIKKTIFPDKSFDLFGLPEEITLQIFKEAVSSKGDVSKLSPLSKNVYRFVNDDKIWKKLSIENDYPLLPTMDWKSSYQFIEREVNELTELVIKNIPFYFDLDGKQRVRATYLLEKISKVYLQLEKIDEAKQFSDHHFRSYLPCFSSINIVKKYLQLEQTNNAIEYIATFKVRELIDVAQFELLKDSLQKGEKDKALELRAKISAPKTLALAYIKFHKVYPDEVNKKQILELINSIPFELDKVMALIEYVKIYPNELHIVETAIKKLYSFKVLALIELYKYLTTQTKLDKTVQFDDDYLESLLKTIKEHVLNDNILNREEAPKELKELVKIYLQRKEREKAIDLIDYFLINNFNDKAALTQIEIVKAYPNDGEIHKAKVYIDKISDPYLQGVARLEFLRVLIEVGKK